MAYIKVLKDNELIGGTDNTDVYPVTTSQAIFSQKDNGEVRLGEDGKPERLEDRLAEIEFQIELIKNGGLFIDMVLDPKSIVVEDTTDVLVKVHSSGVVSSITVYENGVSLGTEENVTDWIRTISVTPATMGDIVYEAHIVVNEGDNPIVKRSTLTVTKKQSAISWSKEIATVTMIQDYRVLPTLDTGGLVGTFTYSSSDPNVADFSNNQEYQSINFYKNGSVTIRVDYVDPNHVHQSTSASYSLTINKAIADVSWDVGDTFEYLTSATEPVELYVTKNSPVPLTLVYESTDNRVVIDDQQDWVRLPLTTLETTGDYEDFTVTVKIRDNIYYKDLNLPCSIRLKKIEPQFTWDRNSALVTIGNTPYTFPVVTNIPGDVQVLYRSMNTTVARINNSTGTIDEEHLSKGSATIVAYNDNTTKYKSHSVSYELTVQEQVQSNFYWTIDGEEHLEGVELSHTVTSEQPTIRLEKGNYNVSKVEYYMMYSSGYNIMSYLNSYLQLDANYQLTLPTGLYNYNYSTGEWDTVIPNESKQYKIIAYVGGHQDSNTGQWVGYTKKTELQLKLIKGNWDFDWSSKTDKVISISQVGANNVIPSSLLPSITGTQSSAIDTIIELRGDESYVKVTKGTGRNYEVKAFQPTGELLEVTDSFGQVVVPAGFARIRAAAGYDGSHKTRSVSYNLKITPPATPDYYVGYTKGNNAYDRVEQGSIEHIIAMSEYEGSKPSSCTKTVSAEEACDPSERVDLPVLFIMWKEGCAPTGGSYDWGLGSQTFRSADFVDDTIFNIQRDIVDSNDITWHLAGRSDKFYEDYTTTVNF